MAVGKIIRSFAIISVVFLALSALQAESKTLNENNETSSKNTLSSSAIVNDCGIDDSHWYEPSEELPENEDWINVSVCVNKDIPLGTLLKELMRESGLRLENNLSDPDIAINFGVKNTSLHLVVFEICKRAQINCVLSKNFLYVFEHIADIQTYFSKQNRKTRKRSLDEVRQNIQSGEDFSIFKKGLKEEGKSGVGFVFSRSKDSVLVYQILEPGPASRIGLKPQDKITAVNHKHINYDLIFSNKNNPILGEHGTSVVLKVLRHGVEEPMYFSVVREKLYRVTAVRDYDTEFNYLNELADEGLPKAKYHLANFYNKGIATPRNIPKAIDLYRSAATADLDTAQFSLATLYLEVPVLDYFSSENERLETVADLYRKAANQGNVAAQYALPNFLIEHAGKFKEELKDLEEEAYFWMVYNALPTPSFSYRTQYRYKDERSRLVASSVVLKKMQTDMSEQTLQSIRDRAYIFIPELLMDKMKQAENRGDEAQRNLAMYYMDRARRKIKVNPDLRISDYKKGLSWLKQQADTGDIKAMISFAKHSCEWSIPEYQNCKQADYWLKKAAKNLSADAMFYLGTKSKNTDLSEAYTWFKKASEAGHHLSQKELANFTDDYISATEVFKWLTIFISQDRLVELRFLNPKYSGTWGPITETEKIKNSLSSEDLKIAHQNIKNWLRTRADKDDRKIQLALSRVHAFGLAGPKNIEEGYYWYLRSGISSKNKSTRLSEEYFKNNLTLEQINTVNKRLSSYHDR